VLRPPGEICTYRGGIVIILGKYSNNNFWGFRQDQEIPWGQGRGSTSGRRKWIVVLLNVKSTRPFFVSSSLRNRSWIDPLPCTACCGGAVHSPGRLRHSAARRNGRLAGNSPGPCRVSIPFSLLGETDSRRDDSAIGGEDSPRVLESGPNAARAVQQRPRGCRIARAREQHLAAEMHKHPL